MAKRTLGRGTRAWQVHSVWVRTREGPERVRSAYRFLLDLPPRQLPREAGPLSVSPRPQRSTAATRGVAGTATASSPDSMALQ